jgi:hypothetical protein
MIGLEFVKKIDKNWDKKIKKIYVKNYNNELCPFCGELLYQ